VVIRCDEQQSDLAVPCRRDYRAAMSEENTPEAAAPEAVTPEAANSAETPSASDVPPDCLSVNPRNKLFDEEKLRRGVGIRFKGAVRTNIEEYCISEGWVRVQAGKSLDRKGNPLTIKLTGPVEAWYEDLGDNPPIAKA